MVIKKSDYEKLKSGKVITPDNSESEKMIARLQKENDALKKQMEILGWRAHAKYVKQC